MEIMLGMMVGMLPVHIDIVPKLGRIDTRGNTLDYFMEST